MSYRTLHKSFVACSICRILWEVDLKEDDSGSGMHAYMRDNSNYYKSPPCIHFAKDAFPYSIDQRISFTVIPVKWNKE